MEKRLSRLPRSAPLALTLILVLVAAVVAGIAAWGQDPTTSTQQTDSSVSTPTADSLAASDISYAQETLLPGRRTLEVRLLLTPHVTAADVSADTRASAQYCLGSAALSDGDVSGARELYLQAAKTGVSEKVVVNSLLMAASCLAKQGNYAQSNSEYEAIIAGHPAHREGCANARFHIADALKRQGLVSEALAEFRRVITDYPETSWVPLAREIAAALGGCTAPGGE